MKVRDIVISALIAAAYLVLTLLLAPVSYGVVQFRVSEALVLLPLVFPKAPIGLFVGCLLANIFGGNVLDIIFGSLATLIAAFMTLQIGKRATGRYTRLILGAIPPIAVNAVMLGAVFSVLATNRFDVILFFINAGQIFLSQTIVICVIGIPFTIALGKLAERRAIT